MSKSVQVENPLRILRRGEVEDRTGLSRSSIYNRIRQGTFPPSVSLGGKAVGWPEAAVDSWIRAHIEAGRKAS